MATARRAAAVLGGEVHGLAGRTEGADVSFDNAAGHIAALFVAGVPVVGCCSASILIRAAGAHLSDKSTEPPLLALAEDGSAVVPLLGGHRGANDLAKDLAALFGVVPAITTAGDLAAGFAADAPPEGWRLAEPSRAKSAMAKLVSARAVRKIGLEPGLAPFLDALAEGDGPSVSAGLAPSGADLAYHPQRVTLGVGASRDCPSQELKDLVLQTLAEAEIALPALAAVGTLDIKADEPAILALARDLEVPLRLFGAAELERLTPRLANPSDAVFAETGCHGVAEGAALALAGPGGVLFRPKQKSAMATCALGLAPRPLTKLAGRSRGRLAVVGIGPGRADWRTPEASRLIAGAELLVGYGFYLDLLGPLVRGKDCRTFPLGAERERCRYALEAAAEGRKVALISSGDAGIYAMAALVWELIDQKAVSAAARRVEIVVAPGISALQAAAARIGAPLGHDFCAISLSDLLTPRDDILKRLRAAADGDFVVAIYNPVSARRQGLLAEARDILLAGRGADVPVLIARSLGRADESCRITTLGALSPADADMMTLVLVGSTSSRVVKTGDGPRLYTPRGYASKGPGS
jgi:cobalt-precorrin 5A hydrolase/precorrin-3B C17-methyltransferase